MSDDKTTYRIQAYGTKSRVYENETGLILRTLDTREQAQAWLAELVPPKDKR